MCGIAGYSGAFSPALLQKMANKQGHRGPDAEGVWYEQQAGVGLAHQRLAIIDLNASSNQPMWDTSGRFCLVYNGEIYNYQVLKQKLVANGLSFRTQSDTEVILNLVRSEGLEGLKQLNGIFAFALWDQERKTLWLARDGFGVKPLYFAETSKGVVFASEIKAILEESSLERALDLSAIQSYLTYLWSPGPNTILEKVKKCEPGALLEVVDGKVKSQSTFYRLPTPTPSPISEQEATAQLQHHLEIAVERQMVADVPVGAFLSGGLDSSSIVHYAQKLQSAPLECFTIATDASDSAGEGFSEDLPYAKRVADHLGAKLNVISVGPEMAYDLEKMLYFLDEPQADPAPINALYICQLAREQGYKVLLSGAGGDDVFSGYRRHFAIQQEKYWAWLPQVFRQGLRGLSGCLPQQTAIGRRFAKAFQHANVTADERLLGYFEWIQRERLATLCGPAFEGKVLAPPRESLRKVIGDYSEVSEPLNKMLLLEQKHFLTDHNLNYTDKMAMAQGIEVRVPFLDPDLVSFAARLPVHFKQRGRVGKWLLKKSMEPHLPKSVIYRPKTGFGAPIRQWLRGPLQPLMRDMLSDSRLRNRGLFNPKGVQALIQADQDGKIDASYTLLSLMCIEIWCDTFL